MIGEPEKKIIFVGSDHAGFAAKEALKPYLEEKGLDVTDLGCFSEEPCDYPDIAREVAEKVLEHQDARGLIICGSGIGVSIAANRFKTVRAVNANTEQLAEMGRKHNNANVLTMGARVIDVETMKKIVDKFLTTEFEGEERHERRVEKLSTLG